jgi:hypothetical protein
VCPQRESIRQQPPQHQPFLLERYVIFRLRNDIEPGGVEPLRRAKNQKRRQVVGKPDERRTSDIYSGEATAWLWF